ncbi:MAG: glutathione S-transferase family protein [Sulfuriferula sp.]
MIIFYRIYSDSPNIRKISIMLEEIGLPYTIQFVDKQSDGSFAKDFLAISPNATVPAIVDTENSATLFESGAILYYLAEKTQKLLPASLEERAEVVKWLMFEVANMCPAMVDLYHYMLADTGDTPDSFFQRYKDKLVRYCAILNQQLEGREYLCKEYSIADIALYPWTAILEDMAEINLSDFPNLNNWAVNISKRLAVVTATQAATS